MNGLMHSVFVETQKPVMPLAFRAASNTKTSKITFGLNLTDGQSTLRRKQMKLDTSGHLCMHCVLYCLLLIL